MNILIVGGSGFIGRALCSFLKDAGFTVAVLSRKKGQGLYWDPEQGFLPLDTLQGFDVIINLAGHPIASGLWTKNQKKKILDSRLVATRLLVQRINQLQIKPQLFISASAIGFYGNRGEEELTEESTMGKGFLAEVCGQWENEALQVPNVRLVIARIGIVLSEDGGALQKMLPIFKLGLGGRLGTGKQWMSVITLNDLIRAFQFVIEKQSIKGLVNMVGPKPIRNEDFTKMVASSLHRPAFMHVPQWVLKVLLGELADETVLSSQKVLPVKLESAGFEFQHSRFSV